MFTSHYFPRYFTPAFFDGADAGPFTITALMELHLAIRSNRLTVKSRSPELTLHDRSNRLTLANRSSELSVYP